MHKGWLKKSQMGCTALSDILKDIGLNRANLDEADLSYADLDAADLSQATVVTAQLNEAKSLRGATLPDGSTHS